MTLFNEIYQFLFIASIIFMVHVFSDLTIKMYGRFVAKTDTRFVLTKIEKIIFWLALTIFFTYIF